MTQQEFRQVGTIASRATKSDLEKTIREAHPHIAWEFGDTFYLDGDTTPRYQVKVDSSRHPDENHRQSVWPAMKAVWRNAYPAYSEYAVKVVADATGDVDG